jgi:hypothetical protein
LGTLCLYLSASQPVNSGVLASLYEHVGNVDIASIRDSVQPGVGHVLAVGELLGPALHLQRVLVRRKRFLSIFFSGVEPCLIEVILYYRDLR